MAMATFPLTIYQTRRGFNDVGADDMRYGDISQEQLIKRFRLTAVSNVVDPYTLTRLTPFNTPQSRFAGVYGNSNGGQLSVHECARLLFEELQTTCLPFAFYGPYRQLINQMLTHLYRSTGAPWRDARLDLAYRNQILSDNSKNSTRIAIKKIRQDHFGLGVEDIQKQKFMQFQFFKIWFVLQRFNRFGFRPFFTNMEAIIDVEGGRL